jgi:hypothetical protein
LLAISVVREEDGLPLAGALVIARGGGTDERTHSDAAGRALLYLPPSTYRVQVPIGHGRAASAAVALAEEGAAVVLAVPTGHVVVGTVRGEGGEPLPGVDVVARIDDEPVARKCTTDADGTYRLAGLPGCDLRLEARALGSRELQRQATCALPAVEDGLVEARQDFAFRAGAPCRGMVRDEHGRGVAEVTVLAETTARFDPFEARTDASGRFSFPFALPGDSARFLVESEDVRQGAAPRRTLEAGRSLEVELTVVRGGELTGRVVDVRAVGFASAKVIAEETTSGDVAAQVVTTTDPDGRFRLATLGPGRYRCRVVCRGYPDAVSPTFDVLAGRSLDVGALLLDEGVAVRGRVLDDRGQPAADARVDVRRDGDEVGHVLTDAAGEFVIDGLTPGAGLRLRAARGELLASAPREVAVPPAGAAGVTLVLESAPRLDGVVRDASGAAVSGAWVVALVERAAPVRTDAAGRFTLVADERPCAALVCAPGLQPTRVEAPTAGALLQVVLSPAASAPSVSGPGVRGRLVLDGAAERHLVVMARPEGAIPSTLVEVAAADGAGRFAVSLPGSRGPWELLALDLTGAEEQVLGHRTVSAADAGASVEWHLGTP